MVSRGDGMKLSVLVIAHNEAGSIRQCLESVT
jgi:glycosyltransferase involved in cell wall biosynthesis